MANLKFQTSWRSTLSLFEPEEKLSLVASKLPQSILKFCSENWSEFGFDYDVEKGLIWSVLKDRTTKQLQESIEEKYPNATKLSAGSLQFSNFEEEEDAE